MRKPAFCICENKDADQLRSQPLCFRYTDSEIPLLPKSGTPEDRFSHNEAQIIFSDQVSLYIEMKGFYEFFFFLEYK